MLQDFVLRVGGGREGLRLREKGLIVMGFVACVVYCVRFFLFFCLEILDESERGDFGLVGMEERSINSSEAEMEWRAKNEKGWNSIA